MGFVLELLAFVFSAILVCVFVAAVVLTACMVYVCVKAASKAGKNKDGDRNG